MTEKNPNPAEAAQADASACSALLCVGDSVLIRKPSTTNRAHQFSWCADMDLHNGCSSRITGVLTKGDDHVMQAYDLEIDDGEFGWLEAWLTKIDA